MITDDLIGKALRIATGRKIKDTRAGLGYTCVLLDNGACGLAYTFRNELGDGCGVLPEAGNLIGADAAELIPWLKDKNLLKASIGMAAVNSAINVAAKKWDSGNVLTELRIDKGDTFGMVGNFGPILSRVQSMTDKIYVFEQHIPKNSGFYPEEAIPRYLPDCDVIVITATSIINHTADGVIGCCGRAREICVVGPSTPLCPEVMGRYGITLLAGSIVNDPEKLLRIVSQGGGTMNMKPATEQVLLRI